MPFLAALKVLILAGGLSPEQNHHSHLVHVQSLQALLAERGVAPSDVTVFWADGVDPAPDRAVVREAPPPDQWLIEGLASGHRVDPGPELLNTEWPPAPVEAGRSSGPPAVRPATRAALQSHLSEIGRVLGAGDTLLIAVTDHGAPDPEAGSHINLWGGETYNPLELLEDLAPVGEEARVVLWMSQCFSGGFAELFRRRENLCGTFSTSADRVAYGCHPHLAERTDVGHFLRLREALARHGHIAGATDEVMLTDDTPDVPHLTSDSLLFGALAEQAEKAGTDLPVFIDTRLPAETPRALIASLALRYGLGPLRDYSATADVLDLLGASRHAAESFGEAWDRALDVARERMLEAASKAVGEPQSRAERQGAHKALLAAARKAWDRLPPADRGRLEALRSQAEGVRALLERIDLQEAAALRVAWLLGRAAGLGVLSAADRRTLEALQACESTPLFPIEPAQTPLVMGTPLPFAVQVPPAVEALRPGHLGMAFRDRPGFAGVEVERFMPGSLLAATDLRVGDLLLEVNGEPVQERGGFRERVMLTRPGQPLRLVGRRGQAPLEVTLPSPPMPVLARPTELGEVVGDLRLVALDQPLPTIGEGRPTVLLFWATWCKPCKASLPVLRDWARFHEVNVVAITDEEPDVVRKFLKGFKDFPFVIAIDDESEAQRLLGVNVRPVFALVDRQRRLVEVAEGFTGQIPLQPPPG